ncbi:MAG: peroxiredoxin [Myxococcales bacterium]|nr:peroxiredoxin [Myxococcales bacterium]
MLELLKPVPDFTAIAFRDGKFAPISLSEFEGKWVVLFFYPRDFSYVCPTEIIELSRRAPEFQALGVQLLGISCDSEFSHRAWTEVLGNVAFPLVADFDKEISRGYGVLLEGGFPARATCILAPDRTLQHLSLNNTNVGRSIAELLRLTEALQLGALLPVEWHRGEPPLVEF